MSSDFRPLLLRSIDRQIGMTEQLAQRTCQDLDDRTKTWPKAFRVVLKAEVMVLGESPRFVVTSLNLPSHENLYRDLYCARGQDENWIKRIKNDLASDRVTAPPIIAS